MFRRFGTELDPPGWLTQVATASSDAYDRTQAAEPGDDRRRPSLDLAYRSVVALRRPWTPIGATAVAAVHTLLRGAHVFDDADARGGHGGWLVTLTNGEQVLVRTARPDDAGPLQAMHFRCSPESRYLRYLGTAAQVPTMLLPVLLGLPPDTVALVAETRDRRLVGLANLVTNDDDTAEVAFLVEDSWQRRGLGTALARRLVAIARDRDLRALTAVTFRSNGGPARVLARAGLAVEVCVADDLLELRALLPDRTGYPARPNPGRACPSRLARIAAKRGLLRHEASHQGRAPHDMPKLTGALLRTQGTESQAR